MQGRVSGVANNGCPGPAVLMVRTSAKPSQTGGQGVAWPRCYGDGADHSREGDAKWSYCLAQVKHTAQRMPHSNSHTGLLWWWADRVLRVCAVYPTGLARRHRESSFGDPEGMTATLEELFPKRFKATSSSCRNDETLLLHLWYSWFNRGYGLKEELMEKKEQDRSLFWQNTASEVQFCERQILKPQGEKWTYFQDQLLLKSVFSNNTKHWYLVQASK